MASSRGEKKLGPRPDRSPFNRGLIQNFRLASPPPFHMRISSPHPGLSLAAQS